MTKKVLWVVLAALAVIQFVRPERNEGSVYTATHMSKAVDMPQDAQNILDKACNDCHSNSTRYPWYYNTQPLAWWLAHHVEEGKEELNFSEFGSYKLKRQLHKLEEIAEMVKEGEMPMKSYTLMHGEAMLSAEEKQTLINWALAAKASIDTMRVANQ